MDDRALRISVLLAAHIVFLSAGALRIIRGERGHLLRSQGGWWLQYYPPLVWIPFVVAYFFPFPVDLPLAVRLAGLAIAIVSALFAAWAMWSLGKSYGIRMDLFEGHLLVTGGPYRLPRRPLVFRILFFAFGAPVGLEGVPLGAHSLPTGDPSHGLR